MIDAQTQALLQDILRRESRSLLQYLNESYPWTPADKQEVTARLQALGREQAEGAARVGRFLVRHRVPLPYLGAFPEHYSTANFIGLDYALPRLAAEAQQALADLERDRGRLTDAEARGLVDELIADKRRHVKELEALAGSVPATTVR